MAAAAPVIGQVIVGLVVSKAVSTIGSKLGLSDSTSQLLGVAAGGVGAAYAGGMVGGGSTAASAQTAGATSSQVGTQLPAGYGGPTAPTGSGFSGTGPTTTGLSAAPSAAPAINPAMSRGALSQAMQAQPAPNFTAPGEELVGKVGSPQNPVSRTTVEPPAQQKGMLSQGVDRGMPDSSMVTQGPSTASKVIEQETVGRTAGGSEEQTNWWKRLFSPEKTMDLAMAAMQGYGEAGMRKHELEYPEKIAEKNAAAWDKAYGGRDASLNQTYPSGYKGP